MGTFGTTNHRNKKLAAVFRDKPELVTALPEWMLPQKHIAAYQQMQDLAIVEIAGRDSVAAAVCAAEQNGYNNLLPVYAYTGTEYGQWQSVPEAVGRLARRLPQVRVHPLLIVGSPEFWRALNGRFISDCVERFGKYSPCPGCHLYLHSVRVPLARKLGNTDIVAGERTSHNGAVKINQVKKALDFYSEALGFFGIRLNIPLAEIADGTEIEKILEMPWQQGKEQLCCSLSGNYKKCTGATGVDSEPVMRYFHEFAGPVVREIVTAYVQGQIPEHQKIASKVMSQCMSQK